MAPNKSPETNHEQSGQPPQPAAMISHVSDYNNRYVHEEICFFTQCYILPASDQNGNGATKETHTLTISLPKGVNILDYAPIQEIYLDSIRVVDNQEGTLITWQINNGFRLAAASESGEVSPIEFRTCVQVLEPDAPYLEAARSRQGAALTSRALIRDGQGHIMDSESATVVIRSQSALINYLPEIYHGQDFLARFLMLFESFWKPVELQINGSETYYDASLAPAHFLPWLASWIGFRLDPNLPELRQRQLMNAAFSLYRRRGTRQALIEYLNLFTGGQVKIIEHRAFNLKLGRSSRLGAASALGVGNRPHTFSAFISLPRGYLLQFYGPDLNDAHPAEDEIALLEKSFQRQLENLINTQKPAHTGYQLTVEYTDDEEIPAISRNR